MLYGFVQPDFAINMNGRWIPHVALSGYRFFNLADRRLVRCLLFIRKKGKRSCERTVVDFCPSYQNLKEGKSDGPEGPIDVNLFTLAMSRDHRVNELIKGKL